MKDITRLFNYLTLYPNQKKISEIARDDAKCLKMRHLESIFKKSVKNFSIVSAQCITY